MVQFIPRPKGFGEIMAEGIGQGASQGMQQMQQMMMQAAIEKEKRKTTAQELASDNEILKQKYGIDLTGIKDPTTRKALIGEGIKTQTAAREKEETTKGTTSSLDWLQNNIQYSGKHGVHPKWGGIEAQGTSGGLGILNPETGKPMTDLEIKAKREEIDRTGIWVADAIYTHFNKGVLNKDKWNDVKDQFATRADLPPAINRARMAAARRIMGLPENAPSSVVDKVISSELKALNKIEKSEKELPPLESFFE